MQDKVKLWKQTWHHFI